MMNKGNLYVAVTMDCERIRSESYYGDGTESWETSEKAILGLASILKEESMQGTFLPTPATAEKQATIFTQLHNEGFEVGMQFHCDSFRDGLYKQPLGSYNYQQQKEILTQAKEDWEDAIAWPLKTYRSGYFSANDYTFPILSELGIKQTACSKPGRYVPIRATTWVGALPYVHRASSISRLESGDLDVIEVPTTGHPGERFSLKASYDPTDIRPDHNHPFVVYAQLIDAACWEMEMLTSKVKTLVILTHNTIDYTARTDNRAILIHKILRYIRAKEEDGWCVIPATLADIRSAYLA